MVIEQLFVMLLVGFLVTKFGLEVNVYYLITAPCPSFTELRYMRMKI